MATISNLQARIDEFKSRVGRFSIGKIDFFNLLADLISYVKSLTVNVSSVGIRKVYASVADMNADVANPVGEDGEPIVSGQLVSVGNENDANELGSVYRYDGDAWEYTGKIGNLTNVVRKEIGLYRHAAGKNVIPADGYTLGTIRSNGSFIASENYSYSPVFPIKGNTQYVLSNNGTALSTRFACFYDSTGNVIAVSSADYESKSTWQSPVNARFACVTIAVGSVAGNKQLEEGAMITPFEEKIEKGVNENDENIAAVFGYDLELKKESESDSAVKSKLWINNAISEAVEAGTEKLTHIDKSYSTNLLNPSDFIVGAVDGVSGANSGSSGYRHAWVKVSAGQTYTGLVNGQTPSYVFRKLAFFAADKETVVAYDPVEMVSQFTVPTGAEWAVPTFALAYEPDIFLGLGNNPAYEEYYYTLELSENEYSSSSENSILRKKDLNENDNRLVVNLENSDKILYTGSSSIESYYTPKGKSWLMRAQDFVDWPLVPYGWSGQGCQEIANYLNTDTPSPSASGVKPSEIKPTYAFVGQTLNTEEIDETDSTNYIAALDGLANAAHALGANLLFGTAYKAPSRENVELAIKALADRHKADFIPMSAYNDYLYRTSAFAGFYGNGHPGVRTNELYTVSFLHYMARFTRPKQAVLIFNARDTSKAVVDLVVRNNSERAKLFRTIQIGERTLDTADVLRYDSLSPYDYGIGENQNSEYLSLLAGNSISVADKALVEFVVPKVGIDSFEVNIDVTNLATCYLLNTKTNTWDSKSIVEGKIAISTSNYIDFDKVRMLLVGAFVQLNDVSIVVYGGREKTQSNLFIERPKQGEVIVSEGGFQSDWQTVWSNPSGVTSYNQLATYGADFVDAPFYLNSDAHILRMNYNAGAKQSISRLISSALIGSSFGYKKLSIFFCARLNPKIYNPTEYAAWSGGGDNPYTNVSWYDENGYDYATICIGIRKGTVGVPNSIVKRRVGLFWGIQNIEIELVPIVDTDYTIEIWRDVDDKENESWDMELADFRIEKIN